MAKASRKIAPLTISDEILTAVTPLLDLDLDTAYLALGAYVSQVENPGHALRAAWESAPASGWGPPTISVDLKAKARDFLKRYWRNILAEACEWWKENKDKYTGRAMISGLALAIAPALPPPWNMIAGVLALICVVLIRAGLRTLCEAPPAEPPTSVR